MLLYQILADTIHGNIQKCYMKARKRIKTGFYLKLITPKTMKLYASTIKIR